MSETVVWESVVTVTNTKREIHDAIEHFRSANYGALPSTLLWDSAPQNGAMATLQDNCPRDGHVLIHFHAVKPSGISFLIEGIERPVAAGRPADAPDVKTYARELHKTLRQILLLLTEEFPVRGTVDDFVSWVDEYGYRRQSNYLPHGLERTRDGRSKLYHGIVTPDNRSGGAVILYIARDPNNFELFTVTAEPYRGILPVTYEVIVYMQEMATEIRKRWPSTPAVQPGLTSKRTLLETPPIPNTEDYTWNDAIDWYYRAPRYWCEDLSELAEKIGVSLRTVQRKREEYRETFGNRPMPDSITKFL